MAELFSKEILKDEHVLVTGGGTGLGRAMAIRFASLGAKVTINGRREEPLATTVKDIRDAGGTAEAVQCNIREAESVEACISRGGKPAGRYHKTCEQRRGKFSRADRAANA